MRNPRDMRTIQIEVTNACVRSCSNCTRFCGHHKKPFYMNLETFKKAVDSLEGFDGIVGIMGGEPTLHPNFKEMTEYIAQKFGKIGKMNTDRLVLNDFPSYVSCKQVASMVINKDGGAGLWTSITKQYYKHYELIQNTFSFQNLNDHTKVSYHQPVLITRKEYGIDDEEWIELRDNCWIQNYWSASITPKGVFFCEIAAALDILFNGSGGFPIKNGWWKKDISEFESQFHWCEMCGAALKTFDNFKRDANDGIDDISPALYQKLQSVNSKKIAIGNYKLFTSTTNDIKDDDSKYGASRYVEDYSDRFGDSMSSLRPRSLDIIDVSGAGDNLGPMAFNSIESSCNQDWFLIINKSKNSEIICHEELKELYLNPGCCFVYIENGNIQILFNSNSNAYKKAGYEGFYNCKTIEQIKNLWSSSDIVFLDNNFKTECYDGNIKCWEVMAQSDFLNDYDFRNTLYSHMSEKGIEKGDTVLMLLPASFYFGKAVYLLLENMGYTPHIFIYEGNEHRYLNFVNKDRIHIFKNNQTYDFEKLKEECDQLIENNKFKGSLMLVNLPYVDLCSKDGYDEVVKIAEYSAQQFIGCINIRRRFSKFRR